MQAELEPTAGAFRALADAREALADFDRFGLPFGGGFAEQPASWLLLARRALSARERGSAEHDREEARAQRQSRPDPTPAPA